MLRALRENFCQKSKSLGPGRGSKGLGVGALRPWGLGGWSPGRDECLYGSMYGLMEVIPLSPIEHCPILVRYPKGCIPNFR